MRPIDADALKETLKGTIRYFDVVADIDAAPTIEPKHGKWVERGENDDGTHNIQCSACEAGYKSKGHANSIYTKQRFHFCPNCGAKMERSEE